MPKENTKLSSYTIFCGVIQLDEHKESTEALSSWTARLEHALEFLQYIRKSYYQSFLFNIAPEANDTSKVRHVTLPSFHQSAFAVSLSLQGGESLKVVIPYFDVFLFPGGVCIFAFKAQLLPEITTYENISRMVNHMRQTGTSLRKENEVMSVTDFIRNSLSSHLTLGAGWDQYMPQLKTYTIIDDQGASAFDESLDRTLYELSHVLPIGSSTNSEFTPTNEYFKGVMSNSIAVYNNWKAIALFDTFTRISCSYADTYKTWEQEYFLIYIHGLYTKYQLYSFNSRLKDLRTVSNQAKRIRNRFIEFVNTYHLAYISYKFLPNLIYEKINQSLEIQKELDRLEVKTERIHEAYSERKSKQMNQLLIVISLLSVLSVITDLSNWLTSMGVPEEVVYAPSVPFVLAGTLLIVVFWIFKKN